VYSAPISNEERHFTYAIFFCLSNYSHPPLDLDITRHSITDMATCALIQVEDILSMGSELSLAKQLEIDSSEIGNM